jgi:hypothetical protein
LALHLAAQRQLTDPRAANRLEKNGINRAAGRKNQRVSSLGVPCSQFRTSLTLKITRSVISLESKAANRYTAQKWRRKSS